MNYEWTIDELEGYLKTWSSVHKYIKLHNQNLVNQFISEIKLLKIDDKKLKIFFPIFLKIGWINQLKHS